MLADRYVDAEREFEQIIGSIGERVGGSRVGAN
jgi:hypothetical protein